MAAGPEKEVAVKNGCSVLPSSDLPSSRPLTLLCSPGWKKSKLLPYFSHLMFRSLSYSSLSRTTFPGLVLNSRKKAKPQVHKELIVYTHHLQPGLVSLAHSVDALMLFCSVNHSLLSHLRAPSHWISLLLATIKKKDHRLGGLDSRTLIGSQFKRLQVQSLGVGKVDSVPDPQTSPLDARCRLLPVSLPTASPLCGPVSTFPLFIRTPVISG